VLVHPRPFFLGSLFIALSEGIKKISISKIQMVKQAWAIEPWIKIT
jgi:hypothetical protein